MYSLALVLKSIFINAGMLDSGGSSVGKSALSLKIGSLAYLLT